MPTAAVDRAAVRASAGHIRTRAFGLDIEAAFPIPGAATPRPDDTEAPRVRLELSTRAAIVAEWDPVAPERISTRRTASGRIAVAIDADARAGYLIRAQGFGCYWISADAEQVRCAPLQATAWRWQRYLVGQVLPLAAVLRGLEVFHASAVVVGGRAAAFLGTSTSGKTSLAVNLVLGGGSLMTDDVLAISPGPGGGVLAHPGIGLVSVRHEAAELLGAGDQRRLGRQLGRDREASRVEVPLHGRSLPLAHAVIIDRRDDAERLELERLRSVDPRLLLGGSFNFIIRTPERLTNQLDLCARLARTVTIHRAVVPPSVGPADLARAVEREVAA